MGLFRETGHASALNAVREVRELLQKLEPSFDRMEPNEQRFVGGVTTILNHWGDQMIVDLKVLGWLRDLNLKY